MIRIDTISELRAKWKGIMGALRRDLSLASQLAVDPVGTLRSLGYEIGPEARVALAKALP